MIVAYFDGSHLTSSMFNFVSVSNLGTAQIDKAEALSQNSHYAREATGDILNLDDIEVFLEISC